MTNCEQQRRNLQSIQDSVRQGGEWYSRVFLKAEVIQTERKLLVVLEINLRTQTSSKRNLRNNLSLERKVIEFRT